MRLLFLSVLIDSAVACSATTIKVCINAEQKSRDKPGFAIEPMDSNQPFPFARHDSGEQAVAYLEMWNISTIPEPL